MHTKLTVAAIVAGIALSACSSASTQSEAAGMGADPALPEPQKSLVPTINIAPAKGWPQGAKPVPAAGTQVAAFADKLDHPRWLYLLPDGGVLVAETNAPPKPEDSKGLKAKVEKLVMKRAGAGVPSANRISLLRDTDGDGVADQRSVYLKDLNSPFGMAVVGDALFVADTDAVMRYAYVPGSAQISGQGSKLVDLPAGPRNHHWTKNLIASADGSKLYVTVGSNSNVAENGFDAEKERAAIWEVDVATGTHRIFAGGLRNPNGLAWEPDSGALWTAVNERDELGNDLVPDYITSVKDGGFYGWPYSYYGQHVDERVKPQNPDLVAKALVPDYALGSHTASLGLAAARGNSLPAAFANGMFIGQHGSWNRKPASGYKVIFVPFAGGQPSGAAVDVLTGFLSKDGDAYGRPVGVTLDSSGALLVADDVGNVIWRVSSAAK
ncbi:PQQ-dependent sugar dehydrogenase [Hydrocarboniphaga sp.]|uniref:PQQ-dependent sugar dehydrogenase n=1 Tax=Hydrocarboniphaga sp. TaxID=2033016 RepID=UPI003D0ADCAB